MPSIHITHLGALYSCTPAASMLQSWYRWHCCLLPCHSHDSGVPWCSNEATVWSVCQTKRFVAAAWACWWCGTWHTTALQRSAFRKRQWTRECQASTSVWCLTVGVALSSGFSRVCLVGRWMAWDTRS